VVSDGKIICTCILDVHARLISPSIILFLYCVANRELLVGRSIDAIHDGPIEDVIIVVALFVEEVQKHLSQVGIIWLVFEAERSAIVEIVRELRRKTRANLFNWQSQLLLHDFLILFLQHLHVQVLPRQGPVRKVDQNISYGL